MDPVQQYLKSMADFAILYQAVVSLIGAIVAMSEDGQETVKNLMADMEDFVQKVEESLPEDDPQAKAYRQSLEDLRRVLDRSNLNSSSS
ncbi:hypothetical protein F4X33_20695 [Candidatus Poribacteria bacterium]|nr:hypothetical protein [Candidatus Poribacteria bacterium]